MRKICPNGHTFDKTSACPVCPICSTKEMSQQYGAEFPKIGAPAFRALHSLGVKKLTDLTKYNQKELLQLHGFGPKALRMLGERLTQAGLSFAKDLSQSRDPH
ncbi:hypothetical protein H3C66_01930 [Patescibacteria group bacterium]|nr:hypothetical protein [Patescibacteria group bacterium]